MKTKTKLLVVDDETDVVYSFRRLFEKSDYVIMDASSGEQALSVVRREPPDVILMDIRMPGADGITTLRELKKIDSRIPVVLMTAYSSTHSTIEAMKAGAFDYVLKPFEIGKIRTVVQAAVKASQDMRQVVSYHPLLSREQHEEEIIGRSEKMQEVYKLIGKLSNSDLPVLITGESGTGKELVARAIYHHSTRADKPFLAVNCAAIPEHLLESELFGFHRGAFTGADAAKPGKFEVCDGGTIFLDEIGEMPMSTQGKLLRVLETGEIEKLGSTRATKVNVRVMAATNRDLKDLIEEGAFRADLYYRLHVVEIPMPALNTRPEDIPELAEYFVHRYAKKQKIEKVAISDGALQKLRHYSWPGNVRELENVIRNCLVRLNGNLIRPEDIDMATQDFGAAHGQPSHLAEDKVFDALFDEIARRQPLPEGFDVFDVVERKLIIRALDHCDGNQSRAARLLGITRNTLRKRIRKYGLKIEHNVSNDEDDSDTAG